MVRETNGSTFQIKTYYNDMNLKENMRMSKADNDKHQPPFSVHFTDVTDHEDERASTVDEAKQKSLAKS